MTTRRSEALPVGRTPTGPRRRPAGQRRRGAGRRGVAVPAAGRIVEASFRRRRSAGAGRTRTGRRSGPRTYGRRHGVRTAGGLQGRGSRPGPVGRRGDGRRDGTSVSPGRRGLRCRTRAARGRRRTAGAGFGDRSGDVTVVTRTGDAAGRHATHGVDLPTQPGHFGPQTIALAEKVRKLRPHRLGLRPRRGTGFATDFRCLVLRRLQDVLHAVGERADHVRLIATRTRRRPGAGPGRRRHAGRESLRGRHERQRLAARGFQVSTHPRQHPLQAADVLVDLPPVVTAQHDVEAWSPWPPHVCRHRVALPLVPFTSPRVGRSGSANRIVHSDGAYRIGVNRLLPVFCGRSDGCSAGRGPARLPSAKWTPRCDTRCMSAGCG